MDALIRLLEALRDLTGISSVVERGSVPELPHDGSGSGMVRREVVFTATFTVPPSVFPVATSPLSVDGVVPGVSISNVTTMGFVMYTMLAHYNGVDVNTSASWIAIGE